MANPDQKTILFENALEEINQICKKFQEDSSATNLEVRSLLLEIIDEWK